MEFYYRVVTKDGRRDEGKLKARNERQAREKLLAEHASILTLMDAKNLAGKLEKPFKVSVEKVAIFFRRLATMLGAGVSLTDGLDFLAESEPDPALQEAVVFLTKQVMNGMSLSAAMRSPRFKRIFDPVSIGMVQMGEQTGQLLDSIAKIADQMERHLRLSRSLTSALTYPAVLLVVILAMGLLFTLVLGPGEGGLFAAFGEEIPWPTKVVQSISEVVKRPWLMALIIGGIAAVVMGVKRHLRDNAKSRLAFHGYLLGTPAIGPLIQKTECARLLWVMADGLSVGLPAIKCMGMARDVCKNDSMRVAFTRVIEAFSHGEEFSLALAQFQLFPAMVISMIEVGMESGKLDVVMRRVCETYEEDVQMALDNIARLAEPLLLAFAGAMAAFLALATLLPIINMVNTL